jgi:hypothetical protein
VFVPPLTLSAILQLFDSTVQVDLLQLPFWDISPLWLHYILFLVYIIPLFLILEFIPNQDMDQFIDDLLDMLPNTEPDISAVLSTVSHLTQLIGQYPLFLVYLLAQPSCWHGNMMS